jgi:hypothetical protein
MTSPTRSFAKLAAVLCLGAASLAADALELRGFRGIAWGDAADNLGPAAVEHSDGDVVCYKRERENMLFGDSPVSEVRYCFHDDRLFMVTLDSAVGLQAMIAELERTYGPPEALVRNTASWGNASSGARAELVSPPAGGPPSRLTIYSTKFEAELPRRVAAAL